MVDYYKVLEVEKDASESDIRRSYHRLALLYHPDKAGPSGAAKFKEINAAYEVLSDPKKRDVYNKYGEAGLNAMDDPMATSTLHMMGPKLVGLVTLMTFIGTAMILLFFVFLVMYVDGKFGASWTYVKVFAPVFILDIILGVPLMFLLVIALCVLRNPASLLYCVACAAAIVQTILIPIAKDRNEARLRDGATDFLQWRAWLIPGYVCMLSLLIGLIWTTAPTKERLAKFTALVAPRPAFCVFAFICGVLRVLCLGALIPLVAVRADEMIYTNYFVIIGVPVFTFVALILIERFVVTLLGIPTSPEDKKAGGDTTATAGHEGEGGAHEGAAGGDAGGDAGDSTEARPAAQARPRPPDLTFRHVCRSLCSLCGMILVLGLVCATITMICVRLNYYSNYHTYVGVLTLAQALIPVFIVWGCVTLTMAITALGICCGAIHMESPPRPTGGHPQEEAESDAASSTHGTAQAETPAPRPASPENGRPPSRNDDLYGVN